MTEQTTNEQFGKEIEALDREAREALDRLADKREELEKRHQATELAATRQKERDEERREEKERERAEREHRKAVEEAGRLGKERLRLEALAEEQAETLNATLKELLALDPDHRRAVQSAWGTAPEQRFSQSFAWVVLSWFIGRFNSVVPGIGFDPWEDNPPLVERDALTPSEAQKEER